MSVTLEEIKIQIAVGAIKKGSEIVPLIIATDDKNAIMWAAEHKFFNVRRAAMQHSLCPIAVMTRAVFLDPNCSVRDAARINLLEKRKEDFEEFLNVMITYPQLSFPYKLSRKKIEDVKDIEDTGIDEDDIPF